MAGLVRRRLALRPVPATEISGVDVPLSRTLTRALAATVILLAAGCGQVFAPKHRVLVDAISRVAKEMGEG